VLIPQSSSNPPFFGNCAVTALALLLLPSSINAAAPAAPSNFTGISLQPRAVLFTWQDNSDNEDGFEFFIDQDNNDVWISIGVTAPDITSISISGFPVGITTGVRINAVNPDGASEFSGVYLARLFNASVSAGQPCLRVEIGDEVNVPVNLTGFGQPEVIVLPLPGGLSYDPATSSISGTITSSGYFQSTITATENGNQRKASIGIAVIDAPEIINPLAISGFMGSQAEAIDLLNVFNDPDTESTVLIETSLGNVPVTLFDTAAPATAANFKAYMDDGDWDGSIVHRAIPGFIVQAGGYALGENDAFVSIQDDPPVINEYSDSRPNACGTLSMAKIGGQPDSATNEWFVNLADNAQNLDFQNGGFTSFARVLGNGMEILEAITGLPRGNYAVTVDGIDRTFNDWPLLQTSDNSPLPSELVMIEKIAPVPPMTFELVSNSHPAVAGAVISENSLALTHGEETGQTIVTVAATDLDGARTDHSFTVVTNHSYASWAGNLGVGLPNSDDDGGGLVNAQEFAFGGNPSDGADDRSRLPVYVIINEGGNSRGAMEFYHRKSAPELEVRIEATGDLKTWLPLWSSADGTDAPALLSVSNAGNFHKLVVGVPQPVADSRVLLLRSSVVLDLP
jgi:cyclophilin family peptidyl-prolyl cis-trans isomerase